MPKGDNDTKNEHFVPRCYLKNFSDDRDMINQFDILSSNKISKPVPINSICCKKNLYEFKDENGDFIYRNLIENMLGTIDILLSNTINSIKRKAFDKRNLKTSCFLSLDEKLDLVICMSIQQLRTPSFINELENEFRRKYSEILEENSIRNMAILMSLPIYKVLDKNSKNLLFDYFDMFKNMAYTIGVAYEDCILTSDDPAILLYDNSHKKMEEVIFPLTSRLVLIMKPISEVPKGCKNKLVELNEEDILKINIRIVRTCKRWIYSKIALTDEQIKWIKEERSKL